MKFEINENRKTIFAYCIILIGIAIFVITLFFHDKATDTRQGQSAYALMEWENYSTQKSFKKTTLSGMLTINESTGNILAFYSIHQNVQVYVNEDMLYQYPIENNNPLSDSPGYCWNFIELPHGTYNLKILISSPYSSYLNNIPTFFIGNEMSLVSHIISAGLFPLALCVIMFVVGLALIFYHLIMVRGAKTGGKLLKLGIFAILLSIWSINECSLTILVLKNSIMTSYLSFLSLMALPIPFGMFVKTFYEDNSPIWDIYFKADIIQMLICIFMMAIGMYDLRQTVWTTHVMMVLLIGIVFYLSFMMLKNGVRSHVVKVHLLSMGICAVSLIADLSGFYAGTSDANTIGRLGFLAYIVIMGVSSMMESAALIKKGQEAAAYQKLAYTDQMTGLNNRTCFNIDFEKLSQNPNDVAVIDFDLNNLKQTNDTLGHSAGDKYIKSCATIIYEIFNGIGTCYRVGGDEFVALVEHSSTVDITHYLAMLESSVDAANRDKENKAFNLKMQIAYGCAVYTPGTDEDLEDTYNRADKIMYKDKEAKKDKRNKR